MSLTVFLDSGPLGLVTNPKKTPDTIAAAKWVFDMEAAGHCFIVPATADYEVRRELIRAGLDKYQALAECHRARYSRCLERITDWKWQRSNTVPKDKTHLRGSGGAFQARVLRSKTNGGGGFPNC